MTEHITSLKNQPQGIQSISYAHTILCTTIMSIFVLKLFQFLSHLMEPF